MDLSANRITTLPVELRFMNSVVELNLGENPLSCPPANVSSTTWYNNIYYIIFNIVLENFLLNYFNSILALLKGKSACIQAFRDSSH